MAAPRSKDLLLGERPGLEAAVNGWLAPVAGAGVFEGNEGGMLRV